MTPLTTAQRQTRCKECNGTGYAEPAPGFTFGNDCLVCKGDGWLNIPKPLTTAQRQELWRQRKAQQAEAWRDALEQIRDAKTLRDARKIATEALDI